MGIHIHQSRAMKSSLSAPAPLLRGQPAVSHHAGFLRARPLLLGNQAAQQFAQTCPLTLPSPVSCPFGGICHTCPPRVQAKPQVGPPGPSYKLESDFDVAITSEEDLLCITAESRAQEPLCEFDEFQLGLLGRTKRQAAQRVETAYARVTAGELGRRLAIGTASLSFLGEPPPVEAIITNIARVRRVLPGVTFSCRTCGDTECQQGGVVAYVNGPGQMPIFVCTRSFYPDPEMLNRLRQTIIHESLHIAGIDSTYEVYCSSFECSVACATANQADAWTHLIECLGRPIGPPALPVRTALP